MACFGPLATLLASCALLLSWYYSDMINAIGSVGTGYTAKTICSSVFVANRSAQSAFENDLERIAQLVVSYDVDSEKKLVTASAFMGLFTSQARYHGRYTGCSIISNPAQYKAEHKLMFDELSSDSDEKSKPEGQAVEELPERTMQAVQAVVDGEFMTAAYEQGRTRAIVVLHKGAVVGEGYATEHMADVTRGTGHLGWSMTKALTSVLIGVRIHQGYLSLDSIVHGNSTLHDLLLMTDVLRVEEDYREVGDIPRMLYTVPSIRQFIATYPQDSGRQPGGESAWHYSSALSNIISDVLLKTFPTIQDYWRFPREYLFDVIGAYSLVMETDQSGLFVSSSFSYGTALDWAKVGQLLLNGGQWNGQQILDENYVRKMWERSEHSGDIYGMQVWCVPRHPLPSDAPFHVRHERQSILRLLQAGVPDDTCWFSGHLGQFVIVMPSRQLVVTRLGHTNNMVAPRDPALWDTWQPTWNVTHFLHSVLAATAAQ